MVGFLGFYLDIKTLIILTLIFIKYIFIKDKIKVDDSINFDNLATVFNCDQINREDGIKFI